MPYDDLLAAGRIKGASWGMPLFSTPIGGRCVAICIVAAYFLLVGSITLVFNASLSDVWRGLGVPAMDPHFGDLIGVAAGIEGHDAGIDVRQPNPFDPWHRAYNLPSLWLKMKYLGFNRNTTTVFAFGIITLFLCSVWFVLGPLTRLAGIFVGLFLTSPVAITALERANVDLVVFSLISISLALRKKPLWAMPLILFATILKIYPLGALAILLSPPLRRTLPWILSVLGLLSLYALINFDDLRAVAASTPRLPIFSYGCAIFGVWMSYLNTRHPHFAFDIGYFWGTVFFLITIFVASRHAPRIEPQGEWERENFAFQMGAGIYLVSFGVGVSNDYRMIFLIFCLPLLFRFQAHKNPIRWWAASALLFGMLYVNWDMFSDETVVRHLLFKQALAWGLVASLTGLLGATRSWPIAAFASKSPATEAVSRV